RPVIPKLASAVCGLDDYAVAVGPRSVGGDDALLGAVGACDEHGVFQLVAVVSDLHQDAAWRRSHEVGAGEIDFPEAGHRGEVECHGGAVCGHLPNKGNFPRIWFLSTSVMALQH